MYNQIENLCTVILHEVKLGSLKPEHVLFTKTPRMFESTFDYNIHPTLYGVLT